MNEQTTLAQQFVNSLSETNRTQNEVSSTFLYCFIFCCLFSYIFNTPLLFSLDHDKIYRCFHGNDTPFGAVVAFNI